MQSEPSAFAINRVQCLDLYPVGMPDHDYTLA